MKKIIASLSLGLLLAACGDTTPNTPVSGDTSGDTAVTKPYDGAPADATRGTQAPIINEGQEGLIEGQYIVVLADGAFGSELSAQSLASMSADELLAALNVDAQGITVQSIYSQALQGFSAELTPQALEALRRNPAVKYVEQDAIWDKAGVEYNAEWGIDRIDQRNLPLNNTYSYNYDGSGVTAYVVDTGINIYHQEFNGRARWGTNTTGDYKNYDCDGHGTHVAGTVGGKSVGVAQNVKLVAIKVLNCEDGSGTTSGIIRGMEWAYNDSASGRKVLNMSLGPRNRSTSYAYTEAVNALYNANIVTVVAAGNSNDDACYYSPADAPNAITVGATDRYDRRSSFSNYGSCLDIFAPGSDIRSASPNSNTGYFTISGTSMASPHVAGAVAQLLQQYPNASAAQITNQLLANSSVNKVSDVRGSPNKLLFTGSTTAPTPDPVNPTPNPVNPDDGLNQTLTGSLAYSGDYDFIPDSRGALMYGNLKAELTGPANADFDLYLQQWNGYRWTTVQSSARSGSSETINYNATQAYYRIIVESYSGSGSYTLRTN